MGIVAYPPLVAIGPARQRCVAGGGEFLRIAAVRDAIDDGLRYDPSTIKATAAAHELTKSGEVAQGRVEATPTTLDPEAVDGVVCVLLRTQRLPDAGRKLR
jgi:hypothetical protein